MVDNFYSKHSFAFAQAFYIIIVLLALWLLPGAEVWSTCGAMIAVWMLISVIYHYTPWYSKRGRWILLIATVLLAVGIIANVHYFTVATGGSIELPILKNPDAHRYYYDALATVEHPNGEIAPLKHHGYGLLISWLWEVTGISVVTPLVVNMIAILLCIIISGGVTWRVLGGCSNGKAQATIAMALTAIVCYYINSGTLILKEAGISLAIALIALSLTGCYNIPKTFKSRIILIAGLLAGVIILSFLRYTYLMMIPIGAIILLKWNKPNIIIACLLIGISIIAIHISAELTTEIKVVGLIEGTQGHSAYFYDNAQHRFYNEIVSGYLEFPVWKRILYLPVSAAVQYLVPFPWNFARDMEFGYTLAYAHFSYPWYAVGGLILYYIIIGWRKSTSLLMRMTLCGVLLWLVPAYLFAGTVSRYSLPLLPMLIPAAVYVVATYYKRRSFKLWSISYIVILVLTLVVAYHLQHLTM